MGATKLVAGREREEWGGKRKTNVEGRAETEDLPVRFDRTLPSKTQHGVRQVSLISSFRPQFTESDRARCATRVSCEFALTANCRVKWSTLCDACVLSVRFDWKVPSQTENCARHLSLTSSFRPQMIESDGANCATRVSCECASTANYRVKRITVCDKCLSSVRFD